MMKQRLLRTLFAITAVVPLASAAQAPQPGTLTEPFDYHRYEGRYYEIARLPNSRQRRCASDVVTTFLKRIDGDVSFVNQCVDNGGNKIVDIGRIDVAASDVASRLLRFRADQIGFTPWYRGTYRLVEIAGDYSFAVIGSQDGDNLWILSRTRHLSDEVYASVTTRARAQGYDVSRLVRSPQSGL